MAFRIAAALALSLLSASFAHAADRPAADKAQDALRKPQQTLSFTGVKPGMAVADLLPGGGYFSRLFSDAVGPSGHVYMLETTRWGASNIVATQKVIDEGRTNVTLDTSPFGQFRLPVPVDVFFTSRNYHDLLITEYGVVDMADFNHRVFAALKPGGVYVVLDHSAPAGTGSSLTTKTHRIDEELVKSQVTAAGFRFEGASQIVRNPADDRTLSIFDKKIQGHTDQFLLKFRKPG